MKEISLTLLILLSHAGSLHATERSYEDFNSDVSNEITTLSTSGDVSLTEISRVYSKRLNTFTTIANNKRLSSGEKRTRMLAWLDYAKSEVRHQTNGSGVTSVLLNEYIDSVEAEINRGNFSAANSTAVNVAQWLLNILN